MNFCGKVGFVFVEGTPRDPRYDARGGDVGSTTRVSRLPITARDTRDREARGTRRTILGEDSTGTAALLPDADQLLEPSMLRREPPFARNASSSEGRSSGASEGNGRSDVVVVSSSSVGSAVGGPAGGTGVIRTTAAPTGASSSESEKFPPESSLLESGEESAEDASKVVSVLHDLDQREVEAAQRKKEDFQTRKMEALNRPDEITLENRRAASQETPGAASIGGRFAPSSSSFGDHHEVLRVLNVDGSTSILRVTKRERIEYDSDGRPVAVGRDHDSGAVVGSVLQKADLDGAMRWDDYLVESSSSPGGARSSPGSSSGAGATDWNEFVTSSTTSSSPQDDGSSGFLDAGAGTEAGTESQMQTGGNYGGHLSAQLQRSQGEATVHHGPQGSTWDPLVRGSWGHRGYAVTKLECLSG